MTPVNDQDTYYHSNSVGDNLSELLDETLVHLCKVRKSMDQRPFTTLYRRHQDYIWRICYNFVRDPQSAEDLMQEVFFKAYRGLDNFEGRSSFKTWLGRIATNTCLNELRLQKRRPSIHPEPLEIFTESIPLKDVAVQSWINAHELAPITKAMTRLSSVDLEVLQMKDLDERTYNEIAQILGVSLSAAKMRVHRARLALQVAYDEEMEVEVS